MSPKWDFTSSGHPALAGNASAFIVARGKDSVPAPHAATDIAWLQVVNIGGDAGGTVADVVIRSDTVGGQPPASCEFGKTQDISVKYTSKYCEYPMSFLRAIFSNNHFRVLRRRVRSSVMCLNLTLRCYASSYDVTPYSRSVVPPLRVCYC